MGKTARELLVESQGSVQNHGKLVKSLVSVYKATEFSEFWEDFIPLLKSCLMVFEREPAVERCLEFVAKFATSLKNDDEEQGQDKDSEETGQGQVDEDIHQFLLKLFDFCLQHNNANDKAVRFRVCQLVNKLLSKMGEDAQIEDELYDRIYECMLQRLRDLFPIVRIQAVFALARLQDPTDEDCPIINGYLFLMSCDTNCDVRRAVLTCIAASTKTLPALLDRTRDVKPAVRRLAYQILAEKVHIRALTIAQRITVLENGLHDREESVRDSCTTRLLQAWLRTFQGNTLDLLTRLDVESCIKTANLVLTVLFKKTPAHELVSNFDLLNDQLVLPTENLSCESVLYWRVLCQHLASLGNEGELLLEKVLPLPTAFGAYLNSVVMSMKTEQDLEEQMTNEFILHQLLELAVTLDLSDEAGRQVIGQLVYTLMVSDLTTHAVMETLVKCYEKYQRNPVTRINVLCETIADIREPITHIDDPHSSDEKRQIEIKMAQVRVKLNEMKEELEDSVTKQEFAKAAEAKLEFERLEEEKRGLFEQLQQPPTQEVRTERTDSATILKCMSIASSMLASVNFHTIPASLRTLMETLMLPGIQNDDPAVRNMAVKALGLCCLMNPDIAKKYLILFITISQLDVDVVKVTALKVIFDLLLTFGLDTLGVSGTSMEDEEAVTEKDEEGSDQDEESVEKETSSMESKEKDTSKAQSLMFILTELLNSKVSELRTAAAEGLAKLMLAGRIISPKLISRLLLLWYNPITEDDTLLRHCLGTFFPIYAFASTTNQALVEEAILPTLRTLVNAPPSSPLVEIDINNVVDLLTQLTNARHLYGANKENLGSNCHDTLAVKLCNEILSELQKEDAYNVRHLCRALDSLKLTLNFSGLKDLAGLTNGILENLKDRVSRKTVEKFGTTLKTLLGGDAWMDGDSQLDGGEMAEVGHVTDVAPSPIPETSMINQSCSAGKRDSSACLTISPPRTKPSPTSTAPGTVTGLTAPGTVTDLTATGTVTSLTAHGMVTGLTTAATDSPTKTTCSTLNAVDARGDRETILTPVSLESTSRMTLAPLEHNQTCKSITKVEPDTDEADRLTKTPTKINKTSKAAKRTKDRQKSVTQVDISSSEVENDVRSSPTTVRRSTRAAQTSAPSKTPASHSETESPLKKATRASARRAAQVQKTKRT